MKSLKKYLQIIAGIVFLANYVMAFGNVTIFDII